MVCQASRLTNFEPASHPDLPLVYVNSTKSPKSPNSCRLIYEDKTRNDANRNALNLFERDESVRCEASMKYNNETMELGVNYFACEGMVYFEIYDHFGRGMG